MFISTLAQKVGEKSVAPASGRHFLQPRFVEGRPGGRRYNFGRVTILLHLLALALGFWQLALTLHVVLEGWPRVQIA